MHTTSFSPTGPKPAADDLFGEADDISSDSDADKPHPWTTTGKSRLPSEVLTRHGAWVRTPAVFVLF